MIVMQDIALFYGQSVDDCLIGVARNAVTTGYNNNFWKERREYIISNDKMRNVMGYYNSGSLLLNLRAIRDTPELVNQFISEARYTKPDRFHHDQDVLNFVLRVKVKYLSDNFNFQLRTLLESDKFTDIADSIKQGLLENYNNIVILHFDGDIKPWHVIRNGHKLCDLWWLHARQTPFYEELFISAMKRWLYRILGDVSAPTISKLKLLYYRVIINFTFGAKRVHYRERICKIKAHIDRARRMLKKY